MSAASSVLPPEPCIRCDTLDSVFVSLDCHHHFCLVCMSYLFIKCRAHGANSDVIQCSQCGQSTQLDSPTVQAIKATIQGTLLPNLNSFELEDPPEDLRPDPRSIELAIDSTNNPHKYAKRHSDGTTQEDLDGSKSRHAACDSPSRERSGLVNGFCPIHTLEELAFVCYSCSNYELCGKCVSARHKSHQIRSLRQAMELEAQELARQRQDNNEKIEFVESRERRIEDQRQAAQNKWARVKQQIGQFFGQLLSKIRQREAQLFETCDQHYKTIEHILERQLRRLESQLVYLRNFQEDFKTLLSYDPKTCRPYHALEYFSMCIQLRNKLGDSAAHIDESLKLPVNTSYVELDEREFFALIESVEALQLKQMAPQEFSNDRFNSINSSKQKTRLMGQSLGFITKRRTEVLETFQKSRKGVEKNFPNCVSKFLDWQGPPKQEPVIRIQRNSTKVLAKTSFDMAKSKKQLNITKDGIQPRSVTEVSSPVFRLNYKTGTFGRKKKN